MKRSIPNEVLAVLRESTVTENSLTLPSKLLLRPLYDAVNKVITDAGGKWNRSTRSHLFKSDPRARLGLAVESGVSVNLKQKYQAFYTPPELVNQMVLWAGIECDHRILEPSAGAGNIIRGIPRLSGVQITAIELDADVAQEHLCAADLAHWVTVLQRDFLQLNDDLGLFDRILMNPPFTKGQDIKHIKHAISLLKPGGRLVAICANGTKQQAAFKQVASKWIDLGRGAFKESGTLVATAMLVVNN